MGTSWSARLVGEHPEAQGRIQAALDRVVAEMSHWEPDSHLSRFNRSEIGRWQPLPEWFARVLAIGLEVAAKSHGAFDPAAGHLVNHWGFGPSGQSENLPATTPSQGWQAIELDGRRARRTADVALDFSGIAKGFAVDAVARMLRAAGVDHFLVEIGGELLGHGARPDGQPWWVDLDGAPPLRIALHGLAVATSGDDQRFFERDGRRYSHTIDPRSGAPITNGVTSASVLHESCMMADAWATALTVLGPKNGIALATRENLAARILANGHETLSPALAEMLG